MPTIADLPAELVVIVSRYLFPSDFNNLRLVSRSINQNAKAFVHEYRELQARYRSYTNHGIWHADHYGSVSLAGLLRDVIRTPCHASYIRKLSLYRWCTLWDSNGYGGDHVVERAQKDLERKKDTQELLDDSSIKAVKGCLCLADPKQFEQWTKEAHVGNQTAILAMLVMKLPCLSTLHLTRIDHFDNSFNDAIRCVAKAPESGLLSRLTKVTVSMLDDRAGICLVTAFATLPSMRTIHAESLGNGDDYNNRQAKKLMPMRSGLTELSLRYSGSQDPLLVDLLKCCHDLKVFEFLVDPYNCRQQYYRNHALSARRSPCKLRPEIRPNSRWAASVEKLLLQDYNPDIRHYKDFFGVFHSLTEVDIEFRIIYTCHRNTRFALDDKPRLTDMMALLPITVEKVILRYTDQEQEDFIAMVDEACREHGFYKKERLPHLRHIHLQSMEAPIPNLPASAKPEEYRGNRFPLVENNPCSLYGEVQRCLKIGVTLTCDF